MIIMVIIIIITMINRMIPYGYNPNSLRWGEIQATHQVPHGPPIPPVFQIRREHHGHQQDAFTVAVPRSTVRKTTWWKRGKTWWKRGKTWNNLLNMRKKRLHMRKNLVKWECDEDRSNHEMGIQWNIVGYINSLSLSLSFSLKYRT